MFLRPKLHRFTESHRKYYARICHFKDSVEEEGSFHKKEEITLFPKQFILCCRLQKKRTFSTGRVVSCDWYFSIVPMLLLVQLYLLEKMSLCLLQKAEIPASLLVTL